VQDISCAVDGKQANGCRMEGQGYVIQETQQRNNINASLLTVKHLTWFRVEKMREERFNSFCTSSLLGAKAV
jgi:hypothetical protein